MDKPSLKQVQQESQNCYMVNLNIRIGEYEKGANHAVRANSEDEAVRSAIELEAHDELDWSDGGAYDLGGEFHYSARGVQQISEEQYALFENLTKPMGTKEYPGQEQVTDMLQCLFEDFEQLRDCSWVPDSNSIDLSQSMLERIQDKLKSAGIISKDCEIYLDDDEDETAAPGM
jgi:hypothetical protein